MLYEHLGKSPRIHESAWVAPDATVCGDVTVGADTRIMHGARVVAETGAIAIGRSCIVMENAVVRATGKHDCRIGDHVLVGPTAHVVGATVEDEAFLATGTAVFHASRLGAGSVVRINGVVHVNTMLPPKSTVPIGWIACGDPAQMFSPDRSHPRSGAMERAMNFPFTAYGIDKPLTGNMVEVTESVAARLAGHMNDRAVG